MERGATNILSKAMIENYCLHCMFDCDEQPELSEISLRVRKSDSVDGLYCVTNFYIIEVSFELKLCKQFNRMANHHRAI